MAWGSIKNIQIGNLLARVVVLIKHSRVTVLPLEVVGVDVFLLLFGGSLQNNIINVPYK